MNVCKKYACHRVYGAGYVLSNRSVVSLDASGRVVNCSPLVEETAATEWVGGIILLSHEAHLSPASDFQSLLRQLSNDVPADALYAWHIAPFDFQHESLTPQSIIRRL